MSRIFENWKKGLSLVFLVSLANMGVVGFARRTAGISPDFEPLTYTSVALVTGLSAISAYLVLEFLKNYSKRPYVYFMYLSGFILIASFMPIGHIAADLPGAGVAEINVLGLTHVVAAVLIVIGLFRLEISRGNIDSDF